jgi:protein required for attachment to host cells
MNEVTLPSGSWILVCDGAKALIFSNSGSPVKPRLELVDVAVQKLAMAHDLGTDRPGRVHQSVGSARSANEQTDWHDVGETEFLHATVQTLDALVIEHHVKSLVIVAPPKALGILRTRLTPALKAILTAELGEDLVGHTTHDIELHLAT